MTAKRVLLLVSVLGLLLVIPLSASYAQGTPPSASSRLEDSNNTVCQDVLVRAMDTLKASCDNLGRNKACYANNKVQAQASSDSTPLKFDATGDIAAIQMIRSIVTSPLDVQQGTWGLSLLKLQVNLPDTLPGQNVSFLVFGDTSVENTSGDMKAFYFVNRIGEPSCAEAPADGIVVRSPNHAHVTFAANGVQINIASTVFLRAQRNGKMQVDLVQGSARVIANGASQILASGQSLTVQMGGADGLTPVGVPSKPFWTPPNPALLNILDMLDKVDGLGDNQTANFVHNLKPGPAYVTVQDAPPAAPVVDVAPANDDPSSPDSGYSAPAVTDNTQPVVQPGPALPGQPGATALPTSAGKATKPPKPTYAPKPTNPPKPTYTPKPPKGPAPTPTP